MDRRRFFKYLIGSSAIAFGGVGAVSHFLEPDARDRGETVEESAALVEDVSYFEGEVYTEELDDGTHEAVMELEPIDRKVLEDGEPAYNAVAEELDAEGNHVLGEDNTVLTSMQAFYDHLGKFNATRRDDDQQVSTYTVAVPGIDEEVAYTATAAEMREMEAPEDSDALRYELDEDEYWRSFIDGLEPA